MAKYKLLKDITVYNYKTVPTPAGYVGGGTTISVKDTIRFIIPAGTIVEATPMGLNQGNDPITEDSFQLFVSTKYNCGSGVGCSGMGKYCCEANINNNEVEKVPDNTPTTLDANIIPKDVSPASTPPATKKPSTLMVILLIAAIIATITMWPHQDTSMKFALGFAFLLIAYFYYKSYIE